MVKSITRQEVRDLLDNGENFTLVETLPVEFWNEGHLPGAIRMNYTEVTDKAEVLLPDKEAKIVVYCANPVCDYSTKAAYILAGMGYSNVHDYLEGKQDWIDNGLPLE